MSRGQGNALSRFCVYRFTVFDRDDQLSIIQFTHQFNDLPLLWLDRIALIDLLRLFHTFTSPFPLILRGLFCFLLILFHSRPSLFYRIRRGCRSPCVSSKRGEREFIVSDSLHTASQRNTNKKSASCRHETQRKRPRHLTQQGQNTNDLAAKTQKGRTESAVPVSAECCQPSCIWLSFSFEASQ